MKNFGKKSFAIFSFLLFNFSSLLAAEVEFFFHPNEITLGEVAKLEVKTYGDKPFRTLQTNIKKNGVRVRYVGSGTETQIINFKVSKSQIINFYVDTEREGTFQLPEITVEYDKKQYTSPPITFQVKKRSKNSQNQFLNPFSFDIDEPAPEEKPEVTFHTNKSVFYKGEPIVGYYVLYYNQYRQPFLERDPNQSIAFPFFLSETLRQVTVQIEPEIVRNQILRKTLVFSKEIYGLTALKSGTYSIGKTKFITGDSLRFNSLQETVETTPAKVIVMDLPKGAPVSFTGAIGNFKLNLIPTQKQVHEAETAYFEVIIEGEGGYEGILPMEFDNANIKFISQTKSKTFQKLESGEYGFYSRVKFLYGYQITKPSREKIDPYTFSFFSLAEKKYITFFHPFPEFVVLPKRKMGPQPNIPKQNRNLKLPFLYLVLLAGIGIIGYLGLKRYIFQKEVSSFIEMVESLGKKRNFFLSESLGRKGVPEADSLWFTELISKDQGKTFAEIYTHLSKEERNRVIQIKNKIQSKE